MSLPIFIVVTLLHKLVAVFPRKIRQRFVKPFQFCVARESASFDNREQDDLGRIVSSERKSNRTLVREEAKEVERKLTRW